MIIKCYTIENHKELEAAKSLGVGEIKASYIITMGWIKDSAIIGAQRFYLAELDVEAIELYLGDDHYVSAVITSKLIENLNTILG